VHFAVRAAMRFAKATEQRHENRK